MIDVFGNELSIGDRVVYVEGKNSNAKINVGTVTKFYKGAYGGKDECSVDGHTHILSMRVAKISELKNN